MEKEREIKELKTRLKALDNVRVKQGSAIMTLQNKTMRIEKIVFSNKPPAERLLEIQQIFRPEHNENS